MESDDASRSGHAGLSPGQSQAARWLASLAPAPVPQALLEALGGELASAPGRAALVERGLLSPPEGGPVDAWGPPPAALAQPLLAEGASVDELIRLGEAMLAVLDEHTCRNPRTWPLMRACLPHAEQLAWPLLSSSAMRACNLGKDLHNRIGTVTAAMGLAEQCRTFDEALVARAAEALGPEHPVTFVARSNLGRTLRALHDFRAAQRVHEEAAAGLRRVLGPEHPDTLQAIACLATTLYHQGDEAEARRLREEVLAASRRVLGPEHPDTLRAMASLATSLFAARDFAATRRLEEETLALRRRVLGPEHAETLSTLSALGLTLHSLGDLAGARQWLESALEVHKRVLGPEHAHTLTCQSGLAVTRMMQGELATARAIQQQVLEIRDRFLGPEHPDTSVAAWSLYLNMGLRHDPVRRQELLSRYLGWLLERSPSTLAANQREIQLTLATLLRRPRPPSA